MDEKGLLFLTAKITVVDISNSRDIASIAMKAVEKKKLGVRNGSVISASKGGEIIDSESSEEDERGGIELLDTFKHFVKALDVNKP